jgi:hypothetical protein
MPYGNMNYPLLARRDSSTLGQQRNSDDERRDMMEHGKIDVSRANEKHDE